MIITKYIAGELVKKLTVITFLTFLISSSIGGLDLLVSCGEGCNTGRGVATVTINSIIFIESAMFFIVVSAMIWLTISLSKTNQFVAIVTHSHKKTLILQAVVATTCVVSTAYIFIFCTFASPHIKNYVSSDNDSRVVRIKKAWISTIKVVNNSASGSVYLARDVGRYLDGYSSDSLSIYRIKNGYLASYEKFNKPFLTSSVDGELMFIFRDASGRISRNIEKSVTIDDIDIEFKRESHQNNIGFVDAILNLLNKSSNNKNNDMSTITVLHTVEKAVMLFVAVTLSLCEFPMYHQRIDAGVARRVSRLLLFSIICYAVLEILKIVGGSTVGSYVASITCCIALLLTFLSRLIKHHH